MCEIAWWTSLSNLDTLKNMKDRKLKQVLFRGGRKVIIGSERE
jgi:hypothetical protein